MCPYCDSTEVHELAGGYSLWKCRDCGERFESVEEDEPTTEHRTKFKNPRFGEDAW